MHTIIIQSSNSDAPCILLPPQVQLLHCIRPSNANEGINHLVDGFKVAQDFKLQYPDDFEVLTSLTLPYEQFGSDAFGEFLLASDEPVIRYDRINLCSSL